MPWFPSTLSMSTVQGRKGPATSLKQEIDQALATSDEHAIKFTEACLCQHRELDDPIFLLAAADVVERTRCAGAPLWSSRRARGAGSFRSVRP